MPVGKWLYRGVGIQNAKLSLADDAQVLTNSRSVSSHLAHAKNQRLCANPLSVLYSLAALVNPGPLAKNSDPRALFQRLLCGY